jgi:hypothetical protein
VWDFRFSRRRSWRWLTFQRCLLPPGYTAQHSRRQSHSPVISVLPPN